MAWRKKGWAAVAWIKMNIDLGTSPKVAGIAAELGIPRTHVVGLLHALWSLGNAHSVTGALPCYTYSVLDDVIGHPGFCRAVESVGWLECRDGVVCIPRFDEHNGQSAKARALTARRVADHKAKSGNARVTVDALPREEKRREEKRREKYTNTPPPPAAECVPHWSESKILQAAEQIHTAYPRRVGHADSIKAAAKAIRLIAKRDHAGDHARAFEWLLGRVRAYAASPLVATTDRQYIPHPATWLNAGKYDDHETEWAARPAPGQTPANGVTSEQIAEIGKRVFG